MMYAVLPCLLCGSVIPLLGVARDHTLYMGSNPGKPSKQHKCNNLGISQRNSLFFWSSIICTCMHCAFTHWYSYYGAMEAMVHSFLGCALSCTVYRCPSNILMCCWGESIYAQYSMFDYRTMNIEKPNTDHKVMMNRARQSIGDSILMGRTRNCGSWSWVLSQAGAI